MNIFLDIETIPNQEPWVREKIEKSVKPPASMKKQETIDKWIAEKKDEAVEVAFEKCALKGLHNQIVCISAAVENKDPVSFYKKPEKHILQDFYDWLIKIKDFSSVFIGHNIIGFDLKIIKQRSIINAVEPAADIKKVFSAKPWDYEVFDTMVQWDNDRQNMTSLNDIAQALGIEGKGDIHGGMVYGLWRTGNLDQIAEYCANDVRLVREVYNRMQIAF